MSKKELFDQFNEQANYNLGVRGNISKVVVAYADLAKGMGKEDVAIDMISSLPPASALNNPDYRLDQIKAIYAPEMVNEQSINMTR